MRLDELIRGYLLDWTSRFTALAESMHIDRTPLPGEPQDALVTYTAGGRLEIDNNRSERALRPIAVGRKNWMFFQREGGGRTTTIQMSLLRTAEAAGVNAQDYFHDVLVRIDRERDWNKLPAHAWKQHFAEDVAARRKKAIRRSGAAPGTRAPCAMRGTSHRTDA